MRKKSVVALLSLLSAVSFTLGASACEFDIPSFIGGGDNQESFVEGFEVKESIEVSVGAVVELEQPVVTDAVGVLLDCWTYVTDADGNYVATTAGSFTADNVGVYTITYVVRDSNGNTYEKKTTVTVTGEQVSGDISLNVKYDQFVTVGETIEINAVCSDKDASLSYTVKRFTTGEEVSVDGNSFVPFEAGVYEVFVSAADGVATYKYNIFAENVAKKGEVEVFDEAWSEKEQFIGGKRQDWTLVSSEDVGITDPYGVSRNLAKYTTTRSYIPFFINIREDVDYYKQLAAEGYTHVSMWIYMESTKPHITISDRDPNGGFYRREGPDMYPGQWTEYRLSLLDTNNSWTRSFTTCYDMYANQSHFYFQVDNSDEYNTWGSESQITFYFTDIYAVKDVTVGLAENVDTTKSVKDTISLSEGFNSNMDLTYVLENRGKTFDVSTGEYTFTSNGTFNVTAIPSDFSLRGKATVSYQVEDGYSLSSTYVSKELVSTSVEMNVSELNAAFATVNGITPTLDSYTIYNKNGELVPLTNGVASLNAIGQYTVEAKGVYEDAGVDYATYHTFVFDVWSEATKYAVIDLDEMRCIRAWDWDNSQTTATHEIATVGGRTGDFIKTTAKGQSLTFYAKSLYTKSYYEAILAQNPDMQVRVSVYFTPATTEKTTNFRSWYNPSKVEWFDKYNDQWQTYNISLAKFIETYDVINGKYETYKTASYGANTDGYQGTWLHLLGSAMGRTAYMNVTLGVEATEVSVALKNDKAFALKQQNDLNELLNVTLNGTAGRVMDAEVYFNGEWVALNGTNFTPVWANEYAFRFEVESLDGKLYSTVENSFMAGNEIFEATEDTDVHTLAKGENFDVAELLGDSYTYEIETFKVRGGVETQVDVADGAILRSENLEVGTYFVKVYAIDGNGDFAKILYYTFTLDYVGDNALNWVEEPTSENYKDNFKSYQYSSNQYMTDTIVTTEVPEGRTGSFLKYEGRQGNNKEAMVFAFKPLLSQAYYNTLLTGADSYLVKFDVRVENVTDCGRTQAYCYSWNAAGDKFTTQGLKLDVSTWYTLEIPLETLVKNLLNGEVKFFGVYIPFGGFKTTDWVRMYIGNIRIEKAASIWSNSPITKDMLTTYQYTSNQNLQWISLTNEIPQGGVAGTYIKWAMQGSKEDLQLAVAPANGKDYYEKLLATGKNYKITYDIYIELTAGTATKLSTKLWFNNGEVDKFATHGTMTIGAWHTVEVDLAFLVNNWGNYRLCGLSFTGGGFDRTVDRINMYMGNIQLVEGVATGVATLKA